LTFFRKKSFAAIKFDLDGLQQLVERQDGLGVIGLGLANNFFIYIGIFAGIGIAMPLFHTPIVVLFQSTVDNAFMGRAFSVFGMASGVLMPLGMLVFGPASDTVAIDILLIGTGIVITLLSIPFVASKTLREVGRNHS